MADEETIDRKEYRAHLEAGDIAYFQESFPGPEHYRGLLRQAMRLAGELPQVRGDWLVACIFEDLLARHRDIDNARAVLLIQEDLIDAKDAEEALKAGESGE